MIALAVAIAVLTGIRARSSREHRRLGSGQSANEYKYRFDASVFPDELDDVFSVGFESGATVSTATSVSSSITLIHPPPDTSVVVGWWFGSALGTLEYRPNRTTSRPPAAPTEPLQTVHHPPL